MADWAMHHYLLLANQQRHRAFADVAVRRRQLLLDSGRVFMLLGAVILMHMLTTTGGGASSGCTRGAEPCVALLLWLLGAALAMLSLVAGRFPVLAAAIAEELGDHLLGGLWSL
uniref:Bacterial blight resistance protein Xa27 n=1 Tax=Oryza nivara TaxID=4536 RepID=S4S607_ORYNI|nr:bacterial blight resistance protein Xa27 [Oryza sativa f. spontanea]